MSLSDDGPNVADDGPVVAATTARRWAAELLDVPYDDDRAALRTTVLRKLADDDFMVWEQSHVATTLLGIVETITGSCQSGCTV
jgi:hypothetical protein